MGAIMNTLSFKCALRWPITSFCWLKAWMHVRPTSENPPRQIQGEGMGELLGSLGDAVL